MARKSRRELLEEAARAHSNTTKKVSRLRRVKGVEVAGTSVDPRRDLDDVRNMSAPALRKHVAELQKFNSRSTQFVQGADQRVISAPLWKQYEQLQEQWNARVRAHEEKISGVFIKSKNATVEQEDAKTRSERIQRAGGERSSRPFTERKRSASNIRGDDAMKAIIADMKEKLRPGYFNKRIAAQREIHKQMMLKTGDHDAIENASKLTNQQFNIFWNYAGGAQESAVKYGIANMRAEEEIDEDEERWWAGVVESSNRESNELLEEALRYPARNPENRPRRRGR